VMLAKSNDNSICNNGISKAQYGTNNKNVQY